MKYHNGASFATSMICFSGLQWTTADSEIPWCGCGCTTAASPATTAAALARISGLELKLGFYAFGFDVFMNWYEGMSASSPRLNQTAPQSPKARSPSYP